jgi:hypothetical protein
MNTALVGLITLLLEHTEVSCSSNLISVRSDVAVDATLHPNARAEMSYRLIDELQKKAIPVEQSCRVLGVSRSGFYEARRRSAKPIVCKVSVHLRAAFMASHQSYGSRRLVTALENQGIQVGRYKVRQLMQKSNLKPVRTRKFIRTTDSKHDMPIAANILARQFDPVAPNIACVSDITYIQTGADWLYRAIVLDLFSRKVVGWAMAPSMPATGQSATRRLRTENGRKTCRSVRNYLTTTDC